MSDLHTRLRSETADLHEALEALPFFEALAAGRLSGLAVVSLLRSLSIVHAVLERALAQASEQRVTAMAAHTVPKVPLLVADLALAGAADLPSIPAAIDGALDCGAEMLAHADRPLSLIGTLYVLEGSQAGGRALQQAYARCLEVADQRLSYFGCYGEDTPARWASFTERLRGLALTDDEATEVVASAVRCFELVTVIYRALEPYDASDVRHHVAVINFEAGHHAMPQDPREIALALRAARTAWALHPYLAERFGDRGRRFTNSDSCWLVALARTPTPSVTKNLTWLRTVLASRGIPTVVLESHLTAIAQALALEFPEDLDVRTRFEPFLATLAAERAAPAGHQALQSLVDEFDDRLRQSDGYTVPHAAQLIHAAWVDERSGIPNALAATSDWFVDASRFSIQWIAAVHDLLTALDQTERPTPC